MQKLRSDQHHCARVVFHPLAEVHVGLDALLAGTTKGEIWVDNHVNPQVGLAMSAGGSCYLAGAAGRRASYAALKALIPHRAYPVPRLAKLGGGLE